MSRISFQQYLVEKAIWPSGYFPLDELLESEKALAVGYDNLPDEKQLELLKDLIKKLIHPLREAWGGPISVTSGFRSWEVNQLLDGSASTSDHMCQRGAAVDLIPHAVQERIATRANAHDLARLLIQLDLDFDQFIFYPEEKLDRVHIGWRPTKNRRQFMEKTGTGTKEVKI
jgi:zinc D-Ala-D-Ala carboxypeptidase